METNLPGRPLRAGDTSGSLAGDEVIARLERIPFGRWHLQIGGVLGAGTLFDAFDAISIATVLTVVFTTMHISFLNSGVLISSGYAGQFFGAIAGGWLAERYGRRPVWLVALACFALLSLGAALSWSFGSLLVSRILQGFGLGAEVPVAAALFNEYVRSRHRGLVVTVYESLFPWGLFLAPLVGLGLITWLGPNLGWRVLFGVGALPLVACVFAYFRLPESARWLVNQGRSDQADHIVSRMEDEARAGGASLAEPEVRYRADVKATRITELFAPAYRRRTILSWTQWFTIYFISYGFTTWLPSLYVRIGRLPVSNALILSVITSGIGIVTYYICALLIDHLGRKTLFLISYSFFVLGGVFGVVAAGIFHQTGWPVLFITALLVQLGLFQNGAVYLYTPELYPTRMRAWATSVGSSINRVAAAIGPILVGVILAAGLGIGSVLGMFGVVALGGLVVMAVMGIETKRRVLEEIAD